MKKLIFVLFFTYFTSRFLNLLSLPIFNDESIYLHWGSIMVNNSGQAFLSLFDGKPPLMLWLLGIIQKLPIDPLIAGRGVSIIFGLFTLWGILKVSQLLKFSEKAQIIAGILYITNPLLIFFDRLAILDSAVSTIFIWILFFSLRWHLLGGATSQRIIFLWPIILLGLIQGAGLWIKSTTKLFLLLPFIIPLISLITPKPTSKPKREFISFVISLTIAQLIFLPIHFQPLFPTFQKREGDFLLPLSQALQPSNWIPHISHISLTSLIFLTPFVLLFAFLGFLKLHKKDSKIALILILFALVPLVVEALTARYFLSRYYLFAFLPLLIFTSYSLEKYSLKIITPILLIPISISISLILFPLITLKTLSINNTIADDLGQYYTGWPSGYGVKEAADWLNKESEKGPIVVLLRADSGNPEDAMFVYLQKNPNIILVQANRKPTKEELQPLSKFPIYFVSRGSQVLDMQDQLTEQAVFKKPQGDEFIAIYQVKVPN